MFWTMFILGWILVHGATKGKYRIQSAKPNPSNRRVFGWLIASVVFVYFVSAAADSQPPLLAFWLAALLWIFIVSFNSAGEPKQDDTEETLKLRQRYVDELRERGRANTRTVDRLNPGQSVEQVVEQVVAEQTDRPARQASAKERAAQTAVVKQEQRIRQAERKDQVDQARERSLERPWDGSHKVAQSRQYEHVQRFEEEHTLVAGIDNEPPYVVQPAKQSAASVLEAAAPETETDAVPVQAAAPVQETVAAVEEQPMQQEAADARPEPAASTGWQPPQIDHSRYELDNAGAKPQSIFGSSGPTSMGSGGSSLFGDHRERPLQARAAPEVDKLLQQNRLSSHEELTRPQAVLAGADSGAGSGSEVRATAKPLTQGVDEVLAKNRMTLDTELVKPQAVLDKAVEEERGEGFQYKPTEGITSRF